MSRSRKVVGDFIAHLDWNIVFGGGDEAALLRRRAELVSELEALK